MALTRPATGYTREFLGRFSDRLLFARDCYGGDLLEFLRSLDLPSEVLEKLLHRNAARLVGSGPAPRSEG